MFFASAAEPFFIFLAIWAPEQCGSWGPREHGERASWWEVWGQRNGAKPEVLVEVWFLAGNGGPSAPPQRDSTQQQASLPQVRSELPCSSGKGLVWGWDHCGKGTLLPGSRRQSWHYAAGWGVPASPEGVLRLLAPCRAWTMTTVRTSSSWKRRRELTTR